MKKLKKVLSVILAMCIVLGMSVNAFADDAAVNKARNGVLQVNLTYVTDDGNEIVLQSGTGFLINEQSLITNEHVIALQEETREEMRQIDFLADLADISANDSHLHIFVIAQRDMKVEAKCHSSAYSAEVDFAVLVLVNPIYNRTVLELADSDEIQPSERLYALGMPASSINTTESHTSDDVSITAGIASKLTELNGIKVIEHDVKISEGCSGGPLVNENGQVVAVNSYQGIDYYYSIQINHIKVALDTFGIEYTSASESSTVMDNPVSPEETVPETESAAPVETAPSLEDNSALYDTLNAEISDAKLVAADSSGYTEVSMNLLNDAIDDAERVAARSDASAAELQNSIDALKAAVRDLEEKSGPDMMIIIIIIAAVFFVVILVVLLIVLLGKGKKKNTLAPIPAPAPPVEPVRPSVDDISGFKPPVSDDSTLTTVLNGGVGETMVLNENRSTAYLVRTKTGARISISKARFMIGKERRKVEYCIADNASISRTHALIEKRGSDYYITDQGSTNYTFVNGTQIAPNQPQLLTEGSVIKLSDEEFEFHL